MFPLPETWDLLARYAASGDDGLRLADIGWLPPDELGLHISFLLENNWLEICDFEDPEVAPDGPIIRISLGSPSAHRITALGRLSLKQEYQRRDRAAQQQREKEQEQAKAEKDKVKDRRHDYLVAIIGVVLGALVTLFVEHFNEIFPLK